MPYSSTEGKSWIRRLLADVEPSSILDVGAGSGTYADLLQPVLPDCRFRAIEVHEPYIERFRLAAKYETILTVDVRKWGSYLFWATADVVILGDVLEHLAHADAVATWHVARTAAEVGVVLSLPIVEYPQGAVDGNEHEAHLHTWSHESVLAELEGITEWWTGEEIGAYWAPTAGARTGRPS
jgi:SAM-dependent methyltransferase